MTYQYRLILPNGHCIDRSLPFFAKIGDSMDIQEGSFSVLMVDPTSIYTGRIVLYLARF